MAFKKGQQVLYSLPGSGKKVSAKIIERKIDYHNNYISTPFAKGNFDYLIEIKRDGIIEHIFCIEEDLD